MNNYRYRTDSGEIHEVGLEEALKAGAFLTLPDGTLARRVHDAQPVQERERVELIPEHISSVSLSFPDYQLQEFESARQRGGLRGVEFVKDSAFSETRHYNVKFDSPKAKARYLKAMQMHEKGGSMGAILSPDQLERARFRHAPLDGA